MGIAMFHWLTHGFRSFAGRLAGHRRLVCLVVSVVLCPISAAWAQSMPSVKQQPNVIFVLADDLSTNLVPYMPNLQAMQKGGMSFNNYFVTNSLCCPSRSSIFTGHLPHNTKVMTNDSPTGGYDGFIDNGNQAQSFSVALQKSGYRTAMMGKFLNGYRPPKHPVPLGWTDWFVIGGGGYSGYNYIASDNGKVVRRGQQADDFATDVLSAQAQAFIRSAGSKPFFLEVATFSPHAPYTPAPRHAHLFSDLKAPQSPAFGWRADANAPKWQQDMSALTPKDIKQIDEAFRKRVQSVQAIDEMLGRLRQTVTEMGKADSTFIIFSSDNGLHLGEYSMRAGKMTPFDIDVRVPLVVTGPGVAKGVASDQIVANIDLGPTFVDWAGTSMPSLPDGRSFAGLLGNAVQPWRTTISIEHLNHLHSAEDPDAPVQYGGNPPTYTALRTAQALYVEYATGEAAYYDLKTDPFELHNTVNGLPSAQRTQLKGALLTHQRCRGAECWQAQGFTDR